MKTINESFEIIKKHINKIPIVSVLVLGSGWNKFVDKVNINHKIPYQDIFGVKSTAKGHAGELIIGDYRKKDIIIMNGRFHMYEGYSAYEITFPIRLFAKLGIKNLVLTAACGGLNPLYKVGDFVIFNDILTLFLALDNPVIGPNFVDMSEPFDKSLRKVAVRSCINNDISFREGVYVYYHGPNYETKIDKSALYRLGADCVGMSTVPETISARSYNMKVLGLGLITNLAFVKHDHREVLKQAQKNSENMATILGDVVLSNI